MNFNFKKLTVLQNTKIIDAMNILDKNFKKIILVINKNKKLLGTITDGDIRRGILKSYNIYSERVEKIMNKNPITISDTMTNKEIIEKMTKGHYQHLPIIDKKGKLLGLEFLEDIVSRKEKQRNNLVLIMAGGFGKRMKNLTSKMPKPMLTIKGKPIIEHTIIKLKNQGFKNFNIAVYYKHKRIMDHFGDGRKYDVNINYIVEKKPLGTAGSLFSLKKNTKIPFIVVNGDVFTEANIAKLLDVHEKKKLDVTVCMKQFFNSLPFGVINFKKNVFKNIVEKPTEVSFVSAGINIFSSNTLKLLKKKQHIDMPQLLLNLKKEKYKINVVPLNDYWIDVGKSDDLSKINSDFNNSF